MNLHDWIDELCDLLDIDAEADESLLTDLSKTAVENVHAVAGPVTAFLLGVAVGSTEADPDQVEQMAARVVGLAESWDRPAGLPDETDEIDVEVEEVDDVGEVVEYDEELV